MVSHSVVRAVRLCLKTEMVYLLITALCYTICTILDKHSISQYGLKGANYTFLIATASSVWMLPTLFLTEMRFTFSIGSLLTILFLIIDKIAEFVTSAAVLNKLSGFETKAWLGTAMFLSYFTDILFFHESFEGFKILCILIVCGCLVIMVKDGKSTDQYRYQGIRGLLILYILSKYFYGLIIKAGSSYISPTAGVYAAMVIITAIYFFKADIPGLMKEKRTGSVTIFLTRIPNIVGLVCENLLISTSLTMYSMVQPTILALLLVWSFVQHENTSRISMIGGVICLIAVFSFRLI